MSRDTFSSGFLATLLYMPWNWLVLVSLVLVLVFRAETDALSPGAHERRGVGGDRAYPGEVGPRQARGVLRPPWDRAPGGGQRRAAAGPPPGGAGRNLMSGTVASDGRSSRCTIVAAADSGLAQSAASYGLPSCSCTLACMGVDATEVDRGDPDTGLGLLRAQGVGDRLEAELGGGVGAPLRVRHQACAAVEEEHLPRQARRAGNRARVSSVGATRLTWSWPVRSSSREVGHAAELDDPGRVDDGVESVDVGDDGGQGRGHGQVGHAHVGTGVALGEVGGALLVAGQQHQVVATRVQHVGDRLADAGAGAGEQDPHRVKTTLPKRSPSVHGGEALACLLHRQHAVDHRSHSGRVEHRGQRGQLAAGAHRRADDLELEEEDAGQAHVAGALPEVAPLVTRVPPTRSDRMECSQVAWPTVSITASTVTGSRSPVW